MDEYDETASYEDFNKHLIVELYEQLPPLAEIAELEEVRSACLFTFQTVQARCRERGDE